MHARSPSKGTWLRLLSHERHDRAIAVFGRALELNPDNEHAAEVVAELAG